MSVLRAPVMSSKINRLRHIFGVNVPRHVPSMRRSHGTDGVDHSARLRQSGARLVTKGSKTICKQRSRTKSSVMSLKKSSVESVARGARHYSSRQNVKFNRNGTGKRRSPQTTINYANRNSSSSSFIAFVEQKRPRSYVQMIADYSEAIRKASAAAVRKDDAAFGKDALRKSPFSTLTSPPSDKRMINTAKRSGASGEGRANGSPLSDLRFNPFFDRSIRHDGADIGEATYQTTESASEDRSYVKLISDCGNSAHDISVASKNGALTPSSSLWARSSLEPFTAPARNASNANGSRRIIAREASRVAVDTSRQSSTRVSTSAGASKQPRVELHMVPSAKESVVSINVDSAATVGPSSPSKLASEELSVVVRSNQKKPAAGALARPTEAQWSAGGASRHSAADFGPMRISISEDSAPIKQIEFSINGKPVSELRSIVARTERLDVLTSPDKIEIRVPFIKDDDGSAASRSGSRAENELRRGSDSSLQRQVLNVQISANFQNEPARGSIERPHNAPATGTTSAPTPLPATRSLLRDPSAILDDDVARQRGTFLHRRDIKANAIEGEIDGRRISRGGENSKVQRVTTRKMSADESATDVSTIARANNAETRKLRAENMTNRRYPGGSKDGRSESTDTRAPTNMIPWWSSSDGFDRMRKKEDKPADWSENKSPGASKKAVQSTNNTASHSSDTIAHSSQQREQFKPTVHYPSLFRLKSDRENLDTTSQVMKNGSSVKTVQTPGAEKDGEKISSVKRTEPAALSALETTNVRSEHDDASGGLDAHVKKASVSPGKFQASKDTRDSLLKQDREKKSDYPLKEAHSINDAFSSAKAKVTGIPGDMEPLEKREDGSLIDYGLKVPSRKSTMKLNSVAKETRDPSPEAPKTLMHSPDSASHRCMFKIAPKGDQINKAAELKRAERDEARDDPIVKDLLAPADVKTTRNENLVKDATGRKQERSNSSGSASAPKMTETQESAEWSRRKSSELNGTRHLFHVLTDKQTIQRKKSPFAATDATDSSSRTKPNPVWKMKDHNPLTDSTEKKRWGAKTIGNAAAVAIARQTFVSGDLSMRNRRENRARKSKPAVLGNKRNPAASSDPPKRSSGLASFKSADPRMMRMRTDAKFSESRANFSGSQPIGSAPPWTRVDRPEKMVLYSAWLQRFKHDVGDDEKLF